MWAIPFGVGRGATRSRSSFTGSFLRSSERGWDGAPRFLGIDEQGREVLTFVAGHVAWEPVQPSGVTSEESLARVAVMVRQFHDVTAGTDLAGGEEVVCHNDLSPKNTVYRDLGSGLRPVAFIDWDIAAPGRGSTTLRMCAGSTCAWDRMALRCGRPLMGSG